MNESANRPKSKLLRKSPRHINTERSNKTDRSTNAAEPNKLQHSNNFKQPAKSKPPTNADQPNNSDRSDKPQRPNKSQRRANKSEQSKKPQRPNKSQQSKLLVRRLTFKLFRDIAIYTVAAIVLALILNATFIPRIANWVADNTSSTRHIDFDSTSLANALSILNAEVYYVVNNPTELFAISNQGIVDEMLAISSDSMASAYAGNDTASDSYSDSASSGTDTSNDIDIASGIGFSSDDDSSNGASLIGGGNAVSADPADGGNSAGASSYGLSAYDASANNVQGDDNAKVPENEYSTEYNAILKESADGESIIQAWGLAPLSTAQAVASVANEDTSLLLCQVEAEGEMPHWYEVRALKELATSKLINNGSFGENVQVIQYDENSVTIRELSTYASVKELKIPVAIALYLFGLLIVILLGYGRALKYYDDLVGAVASLVGDREKPIQLPPILASTQSELNEIRLASLADERAAQAAERRKDELVAYLAHDVKTPLTSVIGYLNLLDEAPDMPEESRRKYIQTAFQKSERLEELIDEFFEITRYNLQAIPIERTYIDARIFCEQVVEEFYPEANSRALTLTVNITTDGSIFVDPDKLARALGNVVRNAVAYADPNTEISVSMEMQQDETQQENADPYWIIQVENRGREISKAHLESIFDKFYREEKSRTSTSGRAGLGLAIAKEIVIAHGGEISAESEDGRTVFTIILPA